MAERIPKALQTKVSERLHFYEDLGVRLFYKQRGASEWQPAATPTAGSVRAPVQEQISHEEAALPKITRKPELPKAAQPASRMVSRHPRLPQQPGNQTCCPSPRRHRS